MVWRHLCVQNGRFHPRSDAICFFPRDHIVRSDDCNFHASHHQSDGSICSLGILPRSLSRLPFTATPHHHLPLKPFPPPQLLRRVRLQALWSCLQTISCLRQDWGFFLFQPVRSLHATRETCASRAVLRESSNLSCFCAICIPTVLYL